MGQRLTTATELLQMASYLALFSFVVTVVSVVVHPSEASAQTPERIAEIRVHGNHTTPDAEIIALSGLAVGDPATEARLAEAERTLTLFHRFEDVEIRKRYLSLDDPSQVLAMIVVNELIGVSETDLTPGWGRRTRASMMWWPTLRWEDGYGMTYGARLAWIDPLGRNTRLSVPLTWGGERRAGVELERLFGGRRGIFGIGSRQPVLRVSGGLSAYRRVNPHYIASDRRLEARVRAEVPATSWLRAGGGVRTAQVTFGSSDLPRTPRGINALRTEARHDAFSADVIVDTRIDPSFPRNAIYASLTREQLRFDGYESDAGSAARNPAYTGPAYDAAGRWLTDVRGYVGAFGSSVVALRAQIETSDRPLPPAEQSLLGGADILRGYRAGYQASDNMAALSAELRMLLTSPRNVGRFGVKGFVDWGTSWAHGSRFDAAAWERGVGGGLFFGGGPVIFDMAAAFGKDGNRRLHFGLGVTF